MFISLLVGMSFDRVRGWGKVATAIIERVQRTGQRPRACTGLHVCWNQNFEGNLVMDVSMVNASSFAIEERRQVVSRV